MSVLRADGAPSRPGASTRLGPVVHLGATALVLPVLLLGQRLGFVADVPPLVLSATLIGAAAVSVGAAYLWPFSESNRGVVPRLLCSFAAIATVIYLIGWGAVLGIGYVFGAIEEFRVSGSTIARPAIASVVLMTALGESAVTLGWVDSNVGVAQGHGLALLTALGTCLIIAYLGLAYAEKERFEASLRYSDERLKALVRHASDAIVVIEADGTVLYASPAIERLLGHGPADLPRMDRGLVHDDHLELAQALFRDLLTRPRAVRWIEIPLAHADGEYRWFEVGVTNMLDDPAVGGLVCNMRDITERRSAREQLTFQAYHDALTRLPNRWLFLDQLEAAQADAKMNEQCVGVLFLDVDRFKIVNDSLGHEVGDRMLVVVAERLANCLRPRDVVARFGGDEFTVLLRDLADADAALRVADRMIEAMREPLVVDGHELFASASVGIALSQSGAEAASDLLRQADLAMYVAKEKGRGRWELFDASFAPHVMERLELESDMTRALERGELAVLFQPEVALKSGNVVGAEALLRWNHPHRGVLEPATFVPIAEESSLIVAIDRFVLCQACLWARQWASSRAPADPLTVGVNLSPRFMRQADVVEQITAVLRETGVDPRCIQIEITERSALTDLDTTSRQLHQLRAIGVRVAVDDFGTGYSALAYLKQLPIDVLKLDKSFFDRLDGAPADLAIVQAIVTMGHALDVKVTAEGVEREEQAARLREVGCDSAMGWLWSRAVPPEQLEAIAAAGFIPEGGARQGAVVPSRARA
jgi:diguanylate cyclase (GGDEF)-like protein/PAS domain S-box-containing protein